MPKAQRRKLGNYVYDAAPDGAGHGKHDHVVIETDAPARIVFNDHRRFGLMTLVATDSIWKTTNCSRTSASNRCRTDFNAAYLATRWRARRRRSNPRCSTSA